MRPKRVTIRLLLIAAVLPLAAACGLFEPRTSPAAEALATPTIAARFDSARINLPAPTRASSEPPGPSAAPADAPRPSAVPRLDDRIAEIPIYDTALSGNWSLEHSWGVTYTLSSTAYVYDGPVSIAATPTQGYGGLFFTVRPQAGESFPRSRILGVSFWLSGGAGPINAGKRQYQLEGNNSPAAATDLTVTVVGSNRYGFWVDGDDSVKLEGRVTRDGPLFSETRLYYLGINRDIPPNTWVQVINWLDDRIYDPQYAYVTGIYIKNDAGFFQTFYIDRLSLLVEK